jgi:hypothetical protein
MHQSCFSLFSTDFDKQLHRQAHQIHGDPVTLNPSKLCLNLLLFDGGCCHVLHLLPMLLQVAVEEVLQLEDIISKLQLLVCTGRRGQG